MTASGNEFCGDGWSERYEHLRRHALGEAEPVAGWFFGLEALLQNGMAIWMRAVPTKTIEQPEATIELATFWRLTCQRETTLVLAAMALPQIFSNQPGGIECTIK